MTCVVNTAALFAQIGRLDGDEEWAARQVAVYARFRVRVRCRWR
jgi:hypothetical protein